MKLKSIITLLLIFFGCSNILSAQKKIKANKIFQFKKNHPGLMNLAMIIYPTIQNGNLKPEGMVLEIMN